MSADFADEVSKELDACFGATIPHDGFPGVKFRVWLGNWLAIHTVVPEGAGQEMLFILICQVIFMNS
jgi:hypothetical protein